MYRVLVRVRTRRAAAADGTRAPSRTAQTKECGEAEGGTGAQQLRRRVL